MPLERLVAKQRNGLMVIVSISLDAALLEKYDTVLSEKGYNNRSEAFREMVRRSVDEWQMSKDKSKDKGENIAAIMVVSEKRKTLSGLGKIQHKYKEIQTNLHAHLDGTNCLEIYIVKGGSDRIKAMIKELRNITGVKKVDFFSTTVDL